MACLSVRRCLQFAKDFSVCLCALHAGYWVVGAVVFDSRTCIHSTVQRERRRSAVGQHRQNVWPLFTHTHTHTHTYIHWRSRTVAAVLYPNNVECQFSVLFVSRWGGCRYLHLGVKTGGVRDWETKWGPDTIPGSESGGQIPPPPPEAGADRMVCYRRLVTFLFACAVYKFFYLLITYLLAHTVADFLSYCTSTNIRLFNSSARGSNPRLASFCQLVETRRMATANKTCVSGKN